jgi:SAM-dependent methyltransferase
MPEFATRDAAQAAFWDERYRAGFTPWDARGVPEELKRFVERVHPGRRVLVPGCGSAYEAGYLDERGFEVTAIDIAPEAVARARSILGTAVSDRILREADFFTLEMQVDWIYERALLCALPVRLWDAYAATVRRLLAPGALLAGFFFVDDAAAEPRRCPPFPAHRREIESLFAAAFDCIEDSPVPDEQSIPAFAGRERWMVWQRRD